MIRHVPCFFRSDVLNFFRYWGKGPRYLQRIYIDPRKIARRVHKVVVWNGAPVDISRMSGIVSEMKFWDAAEPLEANAAIMCSLRHWRDGLDWHACGEIDRMMKAIGDNPRAYVAGCRSLGDVQVRCQKLDDVYERMTCEARLRPSSEVNGGVFARRIASGRELNGVLVHLGRDGELLFGSVGAHRLAMCLALNLSLMPAQVGIVHTTSLDMFQELKRAGICDAEAALKGK